MPRPRLLAWLGGLPDVEALYPVLKRLHVRGKVQVDALVYTKLLRKTPGLAEALKPGPARPATKLRMRIFHQFDRQRADGIIGLADPALDKSSTRRRSRAVLRAGTPFCFVQHGVWQVGVNAHPSPEDYAAERLLLWEKPDPAYLPGIVLPRCDATGFLKDRVRPPRPQPAALREWKARHDRILLICHSFRWRGARFEADDVSTFFDMIEEAARSRPRVGFLLRAHRAKAHSSYAAREAAICDALPNVIQSRAGVGWRDLPTIEDALDLADLVVTPTSTVALDAVYQDRPTAILDEGIPLLSDLPQIGGLHDLLAFVDAPDPSRLAAVKARFGVRETNLDGAADAIERWLGA